ncbi:MAG: hypothetical protein WC344_00095 [Bacilli bacterium]|jgi:hypothetical protein
MKGKRLTSLALLPLCASFLYGCGGGVALVAINATFDFDVLNDASFELTADATLFSHLEGHNIVDGDYELTSNLLTIDKNYLVSLEPGEYEFEAFFTERSEKITITVLDRQNHHRLINGGFEASDLFGWKVETTFKGESNLQAFTPEAIVANGQVIGSETAYDGAGNYVYGIPEETTKTAWEEKMGKLVSSDFVLGGIGFLSFMMGAGKNADLNYLRVIDNETGTEIARYGNSLYDTNLTALNNATLNRYQADLSQHLGKSLHLEIIDIGGRDWDFLTFDAIETYLDKQLDGIMLASDIKPAVVLGYAPNQLVNGDFSDGLASWTASSLSGWHKSDGSSNTWQIDSGRLKSNLSGDTARGLIRSSFFRIDGSGVISVEIGAAQGSRFDKDTFISIKERGTNLELTRFANSRHDGIFMVEYYIDFSAYLDRVCYFEIVDNAAGSYDTIFVDNIITYYETRPDFDFGDVAVDLHF